MEETWKSFMNINVSNLGRVKSPRKGVHYGWEDGYGYLYVNVVGRKKHKVHRLVAMLFNDDWDETLTVDHIDEDKKNNRCDNLRMMTAEENLNLVRHRIRRRTGENRDAWTDSELYEMKPIQRTNFKAMCEKKGWIFEEFEEVYHSTGSHYVKNYNYIRRE